MSHIHTHLYATRSCYKTLILGVSRQTPQSCARLSICVTHVLVHVTLLMHVRDMTHLCIWPDSFIHRRLIRGISCQLQRAAHAYQYVWHDSFMYVTWTIHVRDKNHSCMWYDSFMHKVFKPGTPLLFDLHCWLRTKLYFWFVFVTREPGSICASFQCTGLTSTGILKVFARNMLQIRCSVLQCVLYTCCNVLRCVAVCCSVLQCVARKSSANLRCALNICDMTHSHTHLTWCFPFESIENVTVYKMILQTLVSDYFFAHLLYTVVFNQHCVCLCVCVCVCFFVSSVCVCVCVCVFLCLWQWTHAHTRAHTRAHTHTHSHTRTHTHTHAHTYTYTYTHAHICTETWGEQWNSSKTNVTKPYISAKESYISAKRFSRSLQKSPTRTRTHTHTPA